MDSYTVTVRVRYKETDQMQVAYYSNYLVWFEVARVEFFRAIGHSYKDMEEKRGLRLMVVEAQCSYKSPARFDDLLSIDCSVSKIGNTSLSFNYKVRKEEELLAKGKTAHVFTNKNGRPTRIPLEIKGALK